MSDPTLLLIMLVSVGAGYVLGHIHALLSYHKRQKPQPKVRDLHDFRYDPKQFRGGRHE